MSAALTLAALEHLERLDALVAACHAELGTSMPSDTRRSGIDALLQGTPHGAAYMIGPGRAPIGYVAVAFGWSLAFGGLIGTIDEIYVRPGVRRRGIASEALQALPRALAGTGLKALHLRVNREKQECHRLGTRSGFAPHPEQMLMTMGF